MKKKIKDFPYYILNTETNKKFKEHECFVIPRVVRWKDKEQAQKYCNYLNLGYKNKVYVVKKSR